MGPDTIASLSLVGFFAAEMLRRGASARSLAQRPTDRGTTLLIVVAQAVAILALVAHVLGGPPVSPVLQWVGALAAWGGIALRVWAMRVLGQFYTRTLLTVPDQPVIQHGPYRWVRHPGYAGALLTWCGAVTVAGRGAAVLLVAALLIGAYWTRIVAEERMLVGALGEAYRTYQARTRRLVPFLV